MLVSSGRATAVLILVFISGINGVLIMTLPFVTNIYLLFNFKMFLPVSIIFVASTVLFLVDTTVVVYAFLRGVKHFLCLVTDEGEFPAHLTQGISRTITQFEIISQIVRNIWNDDFFG